MTVSNFQLDHLKFEIITYLAELHTSLEIVTIKEGRFSEWLRDNRPAIRMVKALMHSAYPLFESDRPYNLALIALGHLRWYQGQQKSLPVAMQRVQEAHDAMFEAGWYKRQE